MSDELPPIPVILSFLACALFGADVAAAVAFDLTHGLIPGVP